MIAFEPVPETFALLAANLQALFIENVTLINAAVSEKIGVVSMSISTFSSGLRNFYQAHLTSASENSLQVLTLNLDALKCDNKIALVKIDAEGHELGIYAMFDFSDDRGWDGGAAWRCEIR